MKALIAAAALMVAITPTFARDMSELRYFHRVSGLDYVHLYGPPVIQGTNFALYDGPAINCAMHTASYRGQNGRRYRCIP